MVELFEAFELLEKGILPDAGGWSDQCPEFIEAVRAIKAQRDDSEREAKTATEGKEKLAAIKAAAQKSKRA